VVNARTVIFERLSSKKLTKGVLWKKAQSFRKELLVDRCRVSGLKFYLFAPRCYKIVFTPGGERRGIHSPLRGLTSLQEENFTTGAGGALHPYGSTTPLVVSFTPGPRGHIRNRLLGLTVSTGSRQRRRRTEEVLQMFPEDEESSFHGFPWNERRRWGQPSWSRFYQSGPAEIYI
jgi:hypothetical protein